MKDEKITLSVAARALRVSERTLIRYAEKGLISKVKENNRIYFLADEVRQLRQENVKPRQGDYEKHGNDFTVTIPYAKFQNLLLEIGELKTKNSFLLEYKISKERLEKELTQSKDQILETNNWIKEIEQESKEKISHLEEQNKHLTSSSIFTIEKKDDELKEMRRKLTDLQRELTRVKKRGFFKRIFNK